MLDEDEEEIHCRNARIEGPHPHCLDQLADRLEELFVVHPLGVEGIMCYVGEVRSKEINAITLLHEPQPE